MLKFRTETQETTAPYSSTASAPVGPTARETTPDEVAQTKPDEASFAAGVEASAPAPALERTEDVMRRTPAVFGIPLARKDLFGIGSLFQRLRRVQVRPLELRPYRWTRGRKVALTVLVLGGGVGARWYVANQEPLDRYPLPSPASMGIPISDAKLRAPNAASFYQIAADTLPSDVGTGVEKILYEPGGPPVAQLRPLLAEATPALDRLREGFAYQYHGLQTNYLNVPLTSTGLNAPAPNFLLMRQMARLLLAESYLRSLDGNRAGALSSAIDDIRYGQDVGKGYTLIQPMIGTLIENMGNSQALSLTDGLTAAEARAAMARVAPLVANERPFDQIMEGERAFGNAAIREVFNARSASTLGAVLNFTPTDLWGSLAMNAAYKGYIFWYGKQGTLDAYNRGMLELTRRASLPYQQAKALNEATLPPMMPLVKMLIPNAQRAHLSHTRMLARNRVLLAQLAVQAFRAEHGGALPHSLLDLMMGPRPYLESVPADPFSPYGGEALRYKDGKVYSVGENGKDDGGMGDDRLDVEPFPVPLTAH